MNIAASREKLIRDYMKYCESRSFSIKQMTDFISERMRDMVNGKLTGFTQPRVRILLVEYGFTEYLDKELNPKTASKEILRNYEGNKVVTTVKDFYK